METLLILAALNCLPGDRMVDVSDKIPRHVQAMDFVVSVDPSYTRFYIYPLGAPESEQRCCGSKPTSVIRVPVGSGKFCIRQSQPQMKWRVRALLTPDLEL